MIDTERFLQARKEALGRVGGAGGIGTLSEKALHAALKSYYEPDFESREVKVGGFVADIVGENGIIEIQTRGFDRLSRKLDVFLEAARVTVVYPVVPKRGLCWVNPETGEISEKRKSPKKGAAYDVFPELYKIKNQLMHPNFRLCIPLLEVTDYKYLDGYGKQKKLRFEIIRVHRAGNAFQKNKAERGYCEHQKPKKLVRTAEKGRNSKENAAVFRKITCFQKNQKKPK